MWYVYILKCSDNSLYTGITNDIDKRIKTHNQGNGAKYTRGRLPIKLVYSELVKDKPTALRREIEIKKMSRKQKLELRDHFKISNSV